MARVEFECRFCDKVLGANSKKMAWHRITAHELGAHISIKKKGPDNPLWIDHEHGEMGRYRKGCKCDECREAARVYRKEYRAKQRK